MRCEKCPHLKAIEDALGPCQVCESGRLHNTVSIDAAPSPSHVLKYSLESFHHPNDGVTALDPDTEDKLRKCLAIISDFTPLELLLVQNTLHGQTPVALRAVLLDLREKLTTKYGLDDEDTGVFRSVANTWKNAIEEKLPPLKNLFDSVIRPKSC